MKTEDRFRSVLDACASVAMIVASLVLIGAVGIRHGSRPQLNTYKVGQVFEATERIGVKNRRALVLWIVSTCQYCTASMKFYSQLSADRQRTATLVAMGPESADVIESYISSHGVRPDVVVSASDQGARFLGTPTVLLVESDGRISSIWEGQLSQEKEVEVRASLR